MNSIAAKIALAAVTAGALSAGGCISADVDELIGAGAGGAPAAGRAAHKAIGDTVEINRETMKPVMDMLRARREAQERARAAPQRPPSGKPSARLMAPAAGAARAGGKPSRKLGAPGSLAAPGKMRIPTRFAVKPVPAVPGQAGGNPATPAQPAAKPAGK